MVSERLLQWLIFLSNKLNNSVNLLRISHRATFQSAKRSGMYGYKGGFISCLQVIAEKSEKIET